MNEWKDVKKILWAILFVISVETTIISSLFIIQAYKNGQFEFQTKKSSIRTIVIQTVNNIEEESGTNTIRYLYGVSED